MGYVNNQKPIVKGYILSDNVVAPNAIAATTTSTSYVKCKSHLVCVAIAAGTKLRVKHVTNMVGGTGCSRVRINGSVPTGAAEHTNAGGTSSYSDDITIPYSLKPGDNIELWGYVSYVTGGTLTLSAGSFDICGSAVDFVAVT
jgi:hypothetical protein